jgi:hypothetical protein
VAEGGTSGSTDYNSKGIQQTAGGNIHTARHVAMPGPGPPSESLGTDENRTPSSNSGLRSRPSWQLSSTQALPGYLNLTARLQTVRPVCASHILSPTPNPGLSPLDEGEGSRRDSSPPRPAGRAAAGPTSLRTDGRSPSNQRAALLCPTTRLTHQQKGRRGGAICPVWCPVRTLQTTRVVTQQT